MIFAQMTFNSPNNKQRNAISQSNSKQLLHFTPNQLSKIRIRNDDVVYNSLVLSKILIIGILLSVQAEKSQRGIRQINIKLQDTTGVCTIIMYETQQLNQNLPSIGSYVKIVASIKCGGLVYRPEIKIMGISIRLVEDFNEITEHFLQSFRTTIMAQL